MRSFACLLLLIAGLGLALPGLYLTILGGSPYYAAAGSALAVSAALLWRGRAAGGYLLLLVFLGTVIWSVWEVGLDRWALMPRLVFLGVASICLLPFLPSRKIAWAGLAAPAIVLVGVGVLMWGSRAPVQSAVVPPVAAPAAANGEWASYGNTLHGTRYSPLAQITQANAGKLTQAWLYHMAGAAGRRPVGGLEVTPLMVDGLLYGCTGFSDVFALDPITGRQVWRANARIDRTRVGRAVCRGVSYFRAPSGVTDCPARILLGTADNRLIALDARDGHPCRSFGHQGAVDLAEGLGKPPAGWTSPTSPPVIVRGTAVIGSFIVDNQSTNVPSGVVRGYDAVTGRLKWAFDPARPGQPAVSGENYARATPNSWSVASADPDLGLVYLPMGNGSPDFYGVLRSPQTERFSSAVVALDVETGAVRWVFQAIHHDLWDYDLAAQPVVADFPMRPGPVPGLIVPTKTGQIFVLDRRSGRPLAGVEERPVPASTMPGERWSHTQPFSTGMPDFAGPRLREADMWGITPFDQLYCRIRYRQARYAGMFTPPGLGYSIRFPGELGGIDWGSVSVDEARGVMIVNSNRMADWDHLITRAEADREHLRVRDGSRQNHPFHGAPGAAMEGTPYAVHWQAFVTGLGIPCQRPPYGLIAAVDLKTRKVLWQRRLGDASNSGPFGLALHLPFTLGAPNIGGSLVTAGGVVFIAASQDKGFRALSESDGNTLWQVRLPAGGHATPMTYRARDGRQYVVIAAGGNGSFGTGAGDSLIAYRLGR